MQVIIAEQGPLREGPEFANSECGVGMAERTADWFKVQVIDFSFKRRGRHSTWMIHANDALPVQQHQSRRRAHAINLEVFLAQRRLDIQKPRIIFVTYLIDVVFFFSGEASVPPATYPYRCVGATTTRPCRPYFCFNCARIGP